MDDTRDKDTVYLTLLDQPDEEGRQEIKVDGWAEGDCEGCGKWVTFTVRQTVQEAKGRVSPERKVVVTGP